MDHEGEKKSHVKKKKKGNFLRQAKRFGRKGIYGEGKKLSEEEYSYFMRVMEQLKHVQDAERELLVTNFFRELMKDGEEKRLVCNQIVSRILDEALPLVDVSQVLAVSQIIADNLRQMCIDPFASHVVQTLLTLSLKYAQKGAVQKRWTTDEEEDKEVDQPVTDEQRKEFIVFLNKVGRLTYNNLDDFVMDTYASHIVRTVLEVCSGVEIRDSVRSSQRSQTNHALRETVGKVFTVPKKLKPLLPDMIIRFTRLPDLPGVISTDCGSATMQSLLTILKCVDEEQCQIIVAHLLQHGLPGVEQWYRDNPHEAQDSSDLPHLFQDKPTIRLVEVMVTCSTSDQQNNVFQQYFKGNVSALVKHRLANFAVQRLLCSWKDADTFEELYDEVCDELETVLEKKHVGVIHALTQACRTHTSKQSQCIKALMKLLDCFEPENQQEMVVPLMLRMIPREQYQDLVSQGTLPPVSLQGALALQEFLQYNKPIKMVKSLLAMSPADLQMMACDPRGSHIFDTYFSSISVGAKNREKLIYNFKGYYTALACSKHGSRSLEAMWKVASTKIRTVMCNELVIDELKLKGNPFGVIIYRNFKVDMFKRSDKADWQELINAAEKKRKMFDSLLDEDKAGQQKKEKKMKKDSDIYDNSIFIDTTCDVLK